MKFVVTPDNKFITITEATTEELDQITFSLRKKTKNARFNPLVKRGVWDGVINFIDKWNKVPIGLWNKLQETCELFHFPFQIEGLERIINFNFDEKDFEDFANKLFENHPKIKPYDYQIEACKKILKWNRCISELATNSGKTLIMFLVFAYLKSKNKDFKQMLIIVPRADLVSQCFEDFEDYSQEYKTLDYKIQMIGGGRIKEKQNVDIIVGTFQTLRNLPPDFFKDITVVCADESHLAKTNSIKSVFKMCEKAHIKFGLSGTTDALSDTAESFTLISLLGPVVDKIPPDYLIKHGFATPINIKMVYLDYLDNEIKEMLYKLNLNKTEKSGQKLYHLEKKLIIENKLRLNFITDMISKVSTNSLVLFQNVNDNYGKKIVAKLKLICPINYEIFYVDGSTIYKNRTLYKKRMERVDNKVRILVASFGTFSTGISIHNIHNIFLVESYKSEIIIKQSIGRGMRLFENKNSMNVVDFIDDFSYKGHYNYSIKHSIEREKIYKKEKFKYKKYNIKL